MSRTGMFLLLITAMVAGSSCFSRIDMEDERLHVEETMGRFFQAVEDGDLELLAEVMVTGEHIENTGFPVEGRIRGWKPARDSAAVFFKNAGYFELIMKDVTVAFHRTGRIAWISGKVDVTGRETDRPASGTWFSAVLEKRGMIWRLVQTHFDGSFHRRIRSREPAGQNTQETP